MELIRAERPGDKPAIHDLFTIAFPTEQEASLVDRLRENDRLIVSLVAEIAERIVGYIAFSLVTIDHQEGNRRRCRSRSPRGSSALAT